MKRREMKPTKRKGKEDGNGDERGKRKMETVMKEERIEEFKSEVDEPEEDRSPVPKSMGFFSGE